MKKYLPYVALVILVAATVILTWKRTVVSKPAVIAPPVLITPAPVGPGPLVQPPPAPNPPPTLPVKPYTAEDARKAMQLKHQKDLAVVCGSMEVAIKNAAAMGQRSCMMQVPDDLAQEVQEIFKNKGFRVEPNNRVYGFVRITVSW